MTQPHAHALELQVMHCFAAKMQQQRLQDGAVTLLRPEMKVHVADDVINIKRIPAESASRLLVSELMILANRLTAEYALRHDIPVIYRTQPPPKQPVVAMTEYDPVTFIREVRKMTKTRLSTHPEFHSGLGVELYTQVSSPLRRYADLVVLRQISAHFAGEEYPYSLTELLHVLGTAESTANQNKQLEQQAAEYWLLEYLRRHCSTAELPATVTAAGQQATMVELDEFLLRGKLAAPGDRKAGDHLTVRIEDVNPETGTLKLAQVL